MIEEDELDSRTPHGVRGLKYQYQNVLTTFDLSHPARGAWIEILKAGKAYPPLGGSHPARGAWIEIRSASIAANSARSHPARGAWIEIRICNHGGRQQHGRTPHGVRGLKSG